MRGQRFPYFAEKSKLSRVETTGREVGGAMLSVTDINHSNYLWDFIYSIFIIEGQFVANKQLATYYKTKTGVAGMGINLVSHS